MKVNFVFPNIYTPLSFSPGIQILSAILKKNGHKVSLTHIHKSKIPNVDKSIIKNIEYHNPDIIGITSTSFEYNRANEIAGAIKKAIDTPVILGGVHATISPEDYPKSNFDAFVVGEAEKAIVQIANGEIKPKGIINGKMYADLDELPENDWDIMCSRKIIKSKNYWLDIAFSRGCPFNCIEENQTVLFSNKPNGKMRSIKIGDKLVAYDKKNDCLEETQVVNKRTLEREVFEIMLEDGKKIVATEEHPFFTKRGWIKLKDLKSSDEILCVDFKEKIAINKKLYNPMKRQDVVDKMIGTTRERGWYDVSSKRFKKLWKEGKVSFGTEKQKIAWKQSKNIGEKNGMFNSSCKKRNFYNLKNAVEVGEIIECSICGSDRYLLVHHIDFNSSNDDIKNLQVICKSCHAKIHNIADNYRKNKK